MQRARIDDSRTERIEANKAGKLALNKQIKALKRENFDNRSQSVSQSGVMPTE